MPLSNATMDVMRSEPYFDDFSVDNQYHRILFRPKKPVQTRELNQIQSILQNQVERFAGGVFQQGAAVSGGNQTFSNNAIALQLVRDDAVDIANFYDAETGTGALVRGTTSGAEAMVSQVSRQIDIGSPYAAVIVSPVLSAPFVGGEGLIFIDPTTNSSIATMTAAPEADLYRDAATFSIDSGVFFLRGHFVEVDRQTLVLSTTTGVVSARIGLVVTESVVTPDMDYNLLDPALGTTNYAAPGAHRLKITAQLSSKSIVDTADDQDFVEIARVVDGVLVAGSDGLVPRFIEETLARRTYDESGDYVVRPFRLAVKDHNPPVGIPNITGRLDGNTSSQTIVAAPYTTTITNEDGSTSVVRTRFLSEVTVGDTITINGEARTVDSIINNEALVVDEAFTKEFSNASAVVISPNRLNLELEAGKAYVRGFEFETLGTTKLSAPRARTTQAIDNGRVSTAFGPYVFVTRPATANGLFDVNTMQIADLHSVPFDQINSAAVNTTAGAYHTTKIGTARIRSFVYSSGNGDENTVYRMYFVGAEYTPKTFAPSAAANSDVALTGNATVNAATLAVNADAQTYVLTLRSNASTSGGSILAPSNNAYRGATVRLDDAFGIPREYVVESSVSNVISGTLTVVDLSLNGDERLVSGNVTSNVLVTFGGWTLRSVAASNALLTGASVSIESKDGRRSSGDTIISAPTSSSLLFKYREGWIDPSSISDESYEGVRRYEAVTSTADGSNRKFTITAGTGEEFYLSGDDETHVHFAVVNSTAFVPLQDAVNSIVGPTAELTIPTAVVGTGPVDIYARIVVSSASRRGKILYRANTDLDSVTVSASQLVSNLASTKGHVAINSITPTSPRVVGLGVADVYAIAKVYAVANPDSSPRDTTWVDVTNRYELFTGQRDWCYDHSALVLKSNATHPNEGRLLVMIDRFVPDPDFVGDSGYFTAASYTNSGLANGYVDIPTFTDPNTGKTISLRDYVDFRPIREANTAYANTATNPYSGANAVFESKLIPHPQSSYIADYNFYLPRIDKVVVNKDKQLRVLQGTPSTKPVPPADAVDGITLYVVSYPAYTANVELVQLQAFEYRRYTMKDIGKLEKRIENLEYYAQLSMLEQQTLNTREFDGDVERFKNGILVDSFASPAVGATSHPDWRASIDERRRQLRPSFEMVRYRLELDSARSINVTQQGSLVTLERRDDEVVISQGLASKSVNINPFNVMTWFGSIELHPNNDTWFDTITKPTVTVNMFDENDGWIGERPFGTTWSNWTTIWSGTTTTETEELTHGHVEGDSDPREQWIQNITLTTTTVGTASRTATDITQKASLVAHDMGERIVDLSVAPYMRSVNVGVVASGLLPGAEFVALFDDVDVTSYVERANEIHLSSAEEAAGFRVGDIIVSNATTNPGRARVLAITDNILRVVEATGVFYRGADTLTSVSVSVPVYDSSDPSRNPTGTVSRYICYAGKVPTTGVSVSPSVTITLDPGAVGSSASDLYVGQLIHFTGGGSIPVGIRDASSPWAEYDSGVAGCKARVTAYDSATNRVTLDTIPSQYTAAFSAWADGPRLSLAPIYYSIGPLRADSTPANEVTYKNQITDDSPVSQESIQPGSFYGLFRVPGSKALSVDPFATGLTTAGPTDDEAAIWQNRVNPESSIKYYRDSHLQFNVGTRVFRLADTSANESATTFGEARFAATGSTRTVERTVAQTRHVEFVSQERTETRDFQEESTTVTQVPTGVYLDPLAQSFIVQADRFPNGIFLSEVDLFFARKGITMVPVTVQIRPMVNGYPSSDVVLGQARVFGQAVNVVPPGVTPSVTNPNHVTRFTFAEPIYLAGGVEYAIVIMANTQEYEVFVGEVGKPVIGSTSMISEQPYGGSFFKSQNARTWTAEQNEDLMFVLRRQVFSNKQGTAVFRLRPDAVSAVTGVLAANNALNTYLHTVSPFDYDLVHVSTDHIDFAPTANFTTHSMDFTNANTGAVTSATVPMNTDVALSSRQRVLENNAASMMVRATMRTSNTAVSPIYDMTRLSVTAVRNSIDNGQLYANGVVFTQAVPQDPVVITAPDSRYYLDFGTPTGEGGVAANGYFTVNSSGYVDSVVMVSGGSGYIETPTVTVLNNLSDFDTEPTFTYLGETSAQCAIVGEEKARYITRQVTLADGFDANDLKVYISANRPPQTSIEVYYKVLGSGETTRFIDEPWTLMQLKNEQRQVFSNSNRIFREYEYQTIRNSTEKTFATFAIKIVMRSSNPAVVPIIKNFRAIALDE